MRALGPLSLALAGVRDERDAPLGPRAAIDHAAALGARLVQLDAAARGLRARDLDRAARRDLAATLARRGLGLSGLDLWIPPEHFTSVSHADRAVAAVVGALELAGELSRLAGQPGAALVSLTLPQEVPADVLGALVAAADRGGARLADHAWPVRAPHTHAVLGVGLDPATLLRAGVKPEEATLALASPPWSARWSDLDAAGRVRPGAGRLDVDGYEIALAARGYAGPRVIDLRGVARADDAARACLALAPES